MQLLAIGGRLVYSTCTYNVMENEELVAWALANFADLRLITCSPRLGGPGFHVDGLTDEMRNSVQRFGPSNNVDCNSDTIGFFLCCFEKVSSCNEA